ncbi:origin recognition complex subunit 3 [Phymastichus coffea]|uniref:origin recognition complex subunit 3 n=1 Tax=Phymastichus coffea TaxID=108790 RepID=UPI00273CA985|nr:origin recognition complex subunit 3 [Phymastichus coffea]
MEDVSVSKGVFVHAKRKIGQRKAKSKMAHKDEAWYKTFKETWTAIEKAAHEMNSDTFRQILSDMESFITRIKNLPLLADEISTGILLAGVNLPDHNLLLQILVSRLKPVTPYIAIIWSRDSNTLKNLMEEMIYQIVNSLKDDYSDELPEVKRNNCNFCTLQAWHKENNSGYNPIVIIIPDFESFLPKILHDFILILSSYVKKIKFVLIFGVATTLHIVHRSLSYDATSKLKIQVFHTQKQIQSLANLLDNIVLSPEAPFKLTGRAFKFLVDIFLFYDFSVNGFLQSFKLCMWRHFYNKNEKKLCCPKEKVESRIKELTREDLRHIRNLPSIQKYLPSIHKNSIADHEFKTILIDLADKFYEYNNNFFIVLKCLHKLTINMVHYPFGKLFREIYAEAVGHTNIFDTQKYKDAIKSIHFFSKDDLINNIKSMLSELNNHERQLDDVVKKLEYYMDVIKEAKLDVVFVEEEKDEVVSGKIMSRSEWQKALKLKSEKTYTSPYKEAQTKFIEYLDKEVFTKYLKNPLYVPLNEIFCYNDISNVKEFIRGSMKANIDISLNDPGYIFRCDCCSSSDCIRTNPDICIVYKLHLECGKMINLYDWLQSYLTIVDPDHYEDDVDPVLQARFTRAVAELQFLGFIKATRKKTDHVKRLT